MIIERYYNLDLEAFDYARAADGAERFSVRVENAPKGVGGQKREDAEEVSLPSGIRGRVRQLEKRKLNKSEIVDLGKDLADLLLPNEEMCRFLTRSWERLEENEGLRIRLKLETFALADLPWEYIYLPFPPTGFLAHNRRISLVRYEVMEQARRCVLSPVTQGPLRVKILSSNPSGTDYADLDLTGEVQGITDTLNKEIQGIAVVHYPDATLGKLEDALSDGAHVFHFSGHGRFKGDLGTVFGTEEGASFIVLLRDDKQEHLFSANTLKVMLADRGVRLAVLNACESARRGQQDHLNENEWTAIAPALIEAGIPAVVGMQYSIKDDHAKEFSKRLYNALAAGDSIDAAVEAGRQAIFARTEDDRDWGVPVLYLHQSGREGVLFPRPWRATVGGQGKDATLQASHPQRGSSRGSTILPTPLSLLQRDADALTRHIALFNGVEALHKEFPRVTPLIRECNRHPSQSMVVATLPSIKSFAETARASIDAVMDSKEHLWSEHKEPLLKSIDNLNELVGEIEAYLDDPDTEHYVRLDTSAELDEALAYCAKLVKGLDKAIGGMQKPARQIRDKLVGGMQQWAGDLSTQVDKLSALT